MAAYAERKVRERRTPYKGLVNLLHASICVLASGEDHRRLPQEPQGCAAFCRKRVPARFPSSTSQIEIFCSLMIQLHIMYEFHQVISDFSQIVNQ